MSPGQLNDGPQSDVARNDDPLASSNLNSDELLYRENILDHYKHPHNKRVIENATCTHAGKNPMCGDAIVVQVVISNGAVADIAFTGSGCAISQAAVSILTGEIRGKNIEEIRSLQPEDVVKMLGIPISAVRMKCAMLGLRTTQEALSEILDNKTDD